MTLQNISTIWRCGGDGNYWVEVYIGGKEVERVAVDSKEKAIEVTEALYKEYKGNSLGPMVEPDPREWCFNGHDFQHANTGFGGMFLYCRRCGESKDLSK